MRTYFTILFLVIGCAHLLAAPVYANPHHFVRGRAILSSRTESSAKIAQSLSARTMILSTKRRPTGSDELKFTPYSKSRNPCNAPPLKRLLRTKRTLLCEPDWEAHLTATPNDTLLSSMYSASVTAAGRIFLREAWDIAIGSSNTVVGVIDSGIDYNHLDLAANIWTNPSEIPANGIDDDGNGLIDDVHGYDFYNSDNDPMDDLSHGTAVAGTIGAVGNNARGVVGINWNVKMIACKAFNAAGTGTVSAIINCLNYMVVLKRDFGINIVATNNSYGGFPNSSSFRNAIAATRDQDIVYSAGAGNNATDNDTTPFYPAGFDLDNIISVAATDSNAAMTNFSNFGATSVDIAAPGIGVYTAIPSNGYGTYQGTSIATPHVTGAIALVRDYHPSYTYHQAIEAILNSGTLVNGLSGKCSSGALLNVAQALQYSVTIVPTPTPSISPTEIPSMTPNPSNPDLSTARLTLSVSRSGVKSIARCRLTALSGSAYVGLPDYRISLINRSFLRRRAITNSKGQALFPLRGARGEAQCAATITDDSDNTRTIRSKKVSLASFTH